MINFTAMQNGFLRRHLKALLIVIAFLMALSVPLRAMAQAAMLPPTPTPTGTPRNPQTNLEATPTPTPPSVGVSSSKPSVCAGAIGSAVHQAVITATVKDGNNVVIPSVAVSFSVANADPNDATDEIGSLNSSSATTDSNGVARVTFTSSHVIGAKNEISASYGGVSNFATVEMGDEDGNITLSKTDLIADGQDNATLRLPLTSGGLPVNGHAVTWKISQVTYKDANNNVVIVNAADYADYGSLSDFSPAPNANGIYTAKFTTGTKGGTISFEANDESVAMKGSGAANKGTMSVSSASGVSGTPLPRIFTAATPTAPTGTVWLAVPKNAIGTGDHAYLRVVLKSTGQDSWYGFYPDGFAAFGAKVPGKVQNTSPDSAWFSSADYKWVMFRRPAANVTTLLTGIGL